VTARWLAGAAAFVALNVAPGQDHARVATQPAPADVAGAPAAPEGVAAPADAGPLADDGTPVVAPLYLAASTREVRSLAVCGPDAWVATRGGLERYERATWRRRLYGVRAGLDTLDVHRVRCAGAGVEVETATGRCQQSGDAFRCMSVAPRAPDAPPAETFRGVPVSARVDLGAGVLVGTPTEGAFWTASSGDVTHLGPREAPPASFVRKALTYQGKLWLGTFNEGLYALEGAPSDLADPGALARAKPVSAPFRMVNDALEAEGSLYVASNEGLFVSPDGERFERVREVDARGVTSLASDGRSLYATTNGALFRLPLAAKAPRAGTWWRPAGSRSLQSVVVEAGKVWLASEDRGVIAFDGQRFRAYDKLAGLPTSWVVALAGDGKGGVYAGTLRDGALHVGPDGRWSRLEGLPNPWTLSVTRHQGLLCVGTQGGAACYDAAKARDEAGARPLGRLGGLPDGRVHMFAALGDNVLVGTEAGLALYPRPAEPKQPPR
jgi:ligand-binding sensor domain-containing protein